MSKDSEYRKFTAPIPVSMVDAIDAPALQLRRSRAEDIRIALENYHEDFVNLSVALDRIRDPSDPVLGWRDVRRELFSPD